MLLRQISILNRFSLFVDHKSYNLGASPQTDAFLSFKRCTYFQSHKSNNWKCLESAVTKQWKIADKKRARVYSKRNWNIAKKKLVCSSFFFRAICVWPWDENVRTKQKQKRNGNRAIWLVYRMDKNAGDFCLVKRTFQTSTDNSLWPYTVTRLANRKMPWPSPY